MAEPGSDFRNGQAGADSPDGCGELGLGVDGELAELALHVCPPQLDGVQVRAVGRQVESNRTGGGDSLTDSLHFVDTQVVHEDDVTGPQPRDESAADEAQEHASVHRASVRHQLGSRTDSDGAKKRDSLPLAKGFGAKSPLAPVGPSKLSAHSCGAVRLVEEDKSAQVQQRYQGAEEPAACSVEREVPLRRAEGLFFREYPSRRNFLSTEERLVSIPVRTWSFSVSSSMVASGIERTKSPSRRATRPRSGEKLPPPLGRGRNEPVSRCRRSIRLTVASPTSRSAAMRL